MCKQPHAGKPASLVLNFGWMRCAATTFSAAGSVYQPGEHRLLPGPLWRMLAVPLNGTQGSCSHACSETGAKGITAWAAIAALILAVGSYLIYTTSQLA